MARYGGNTSCVSVVGNEGTTLSARRGHRHPAPRGGPSRRRSKRIDILLTHLHMDHIQGLGFFVPLYPARYRSAHLGTGERDAAPAAAAHALLSPPLFPVHLSELPNIVFHQVPVGECDIGEFRVCSALVCHPGPTVGYRVTDPKGGGARLPARPRARARGAHVSVAGRVNGHPAARSRMGPIS
jgi:phosphoribosyl 1,2-cyclic phosphodiesterase